MTFISYKKIFKFTKGFKTKGRKCMRVAAPRMVKALTNMYKERKLKKRLMRRTWIMSMNAAAREHDMKYSRLIYALNHSNIQLDRKVLAELGQYEPLTFKAVIDELKMQTELGREQNPVDFQAFDKAVQDGLIVNPGSPLMSLEEIKKKAEDKPLINRRGFDTPYTPPEKPTPERLEKYRQIIGWDSDEEENIWGK